MNHPVTGLRRASPGRAWVHPLEKGKDLWQHRPKRGRRASAARKNGDGAVVAAGRSPGRCSKRSRRRAAARGGVRGLDTPQSGGFVGQVKPRGVHGGCGDPRSAPRTSCPPSRRRSGTGGAASPTARNGKGRRKGTWGGASLRRPWNAMGDDLQPALGLRGGRTRGRKRRISPEDAGAEDEGPRGSRASFMRIGHDGQLDGRTSSRRSQTR